jgi:hypothetical protein
LINIRIGEKIFTMETQHKSEFKVTAEELLEKIKELIHEGNVRKIIIKNEKGETYLEIPVAIGLIGAILAPVFAAVGALAALAANFSIEVERKEEGDNEADS